MSVPMRAYWPWFVTALVVLALSAGILALWRHDTRDSRRPRQVYDCRERIGGRADLLADCLIHRHGWDSTAAELAAIRVEYAPR